MASIIDDNRFGMSVVAFRKAHQLVGFLVITPLNGLSSHNYADTSVTKHVQLLLEIVGFKAPAYNHSLQWRRKWCVI